MKTRQAAHSGTFYPSDPQILYEMILGFYLELKNEIEEIDIKNQNLLIAPHAGYIFSGKNSAAGYRILSKSSSIKKIILVGPAHYVGFENFALSDFDNFETPLGKIDIDFEIQEFVLKNNPNFFKINNQAHLPEHSLEVQIPFIQSLLKIDSFVPILTGYHSDIDILSETIVSILNIFENVGVIFSSDLSHFLSYQKAKSKDMLTIEKILNLDHNGIISENACGNISIAGFIKVSKYLDKKPKLIMYSNSGDVSGDQTRVVGYASIIS